MYDHDTTDLLHRRGKNHVDNVASGVGPPDIGADGLSEHHCINVWANGKANQRVGVEKRCDHSLFIHIPTNLQLRKWGNKNTVTEGE